MKFCLVATINVIVYLIVLMKIPKESDTTARFSKTLQEAQKLYDWNDITMVFPSGELTPAQNATKLWDSLQRMGNCCGLNDPFEWGGKEEDSEHYHKYPKSCCSQADVKRQVPKGDYVCESIGYRQFGCIKALADPLVSIMILIVLAAIILMLSLLIIGCKSFY